MPGVCLRFRVARGAGEDGIVGRVRMAIAAGLGASVRRPEPGVVKCRSRPRSRGVASRASRGEPGSRMTRICCARVFSRVTGIAVRRRRGVIAGDVAQVALHGGVRAR